MFRYFRILMFGTLRRQLVVGVAVVHAVMMSFFIWDLTERHHKTTREYQSEHASALARFIATSSAIWISAMDIAGLQEIIDAQNEYPDLLFAMITDKTGVVLAHTDTSRIGMNVIDMPSDATLTIIDKGRLMDIAAPALVSGRQVGWVRVGIDQKKALVRMSDINRDGIIYTLIAVISGSFLAWMMAAVFTRRLGIIQKTMDKVRTGDSELKIRLEGTDEASQLADEFNAMIDALSARRKALQQSERNLLEMNANLEIIVGERTRQACESLNLAKKSERILELAQKVAHTGSWHLDVQNNVLSWSDETYSIFGIEAGVPMTFEKFAECIHPDDKEMAISKWSSALSGKEYNVEHRIIVDGKIKWVHEKAELEFDENGNAVEGIGTVHDITDRIQAMNSLKASEQRFRALIEASSQIVWSCDNKGCITEDSPSWRAYTGQTLEQLIGYGYAEAIHHEDRPDVMKSWLEALGNGEPVSNTYRLRHHSGMWRWNHARGVPIKNDSGEIVSWVGMNMDIHEKWLTEEALKENEERFRAIFMNSPDAYLIMETGDGEIADCNIATEIMFGGDRSMIIGKTPDQLSPEFQPDGRRSLEAAAEKISESMKTGKHSFEWMHRRLDGTGFWVHVALSVVFMAGRQVLLVAWRDISERKEAEKTLMIAKEEADRISRAKSEFLANMSHEIRTPLNGVIGIAYLMSLTELDSRQKEYLRKIQTSSRALLGVLNDILDYSKIEAGHLELERSTFCLDDILSTVSDIFSISVEENGLEMFFEIASDVPQCFRGDSLRLSQILTNLVGNAVKFTHDGEIHVTVLSKEISENMAKIELSVKDTGIGISDDILKTLFSPFTQADSSTTRKYGGTGLGLAICKRLVELMGGEISVSSIPGSGSTFTFYVILEIVDAGDRAIRNPADLKDMRTLVADDSETSRIILKQILESWSFRVTSVSNGDEAVKAVRTASIAGNPFELLLLDWKMPAMDGLEAAGIIEEAASSGEIETTPKILMVTAFGREQLIESTNHIRIDGALNKPVIPSELFDMIMEIQNRKTHIRTYPATKPKQKPEIRKPVSGLNVLLVEDNTVNQMVATELLESAGISVTVARNGREAVEMNAMAFFNIILMDLQMPDMDGFEATRRIRSMEVDRHIPILAMTAAAMIQDRNACLEAGMDDHISKPVEPDELFEKISKWTDMLSIQLHNNERADYVPEKYMNASNMTDFNLEEAVARMGGNRKALGKALKIFADDFGDAKKRLESYISEGKTSDAMILVHSIKGVAGNLGARELFTIAGSLETELHSGRLAMIDSLMSEFCKKLASALKSAREYQTDKEYEHAPATYDSEMIQNKLAEMLEIMKGNRIVPFELVSSLRYMDSGCKAGHLFNQLEDQIDRLDYHEGMETIRSIAESLSLDLGSPE